MARMSRRGGAGGKGWLGPLLLAPALAGCGAALPAAPPAPCPPVAVLAEGVEIARFAPGDPAAPLLVARIAGVEARCSFTGRDRRVLEARLTPRFAAARGPAAGEGAVAAELPWFVALSDANDLAVLEHLPATTRLTLEPGVAGLESTGRAATLLVPVGGSLRPADYVVRVSFQLTPAELAAARAGRR